MKNAFFASLVAAFAFFGGPAIAPYTASATNQVQAGDINLDGPGRIMRVEQTVRVTRRVTRCSPYYGCYTTYETWYEIRYILVRVYWSETRNSWGYYDDFGYWHSLNLEDNRRKPL